MQLINPALDLDAIRASYARDRMAVIPDFFAPETAALLRDTVRSIRHWEFWARGPMGTVIVPPERWALLSEPARLAQTPTEAAPVDGFHYAYERSTPSLGSRLPPLQTLGGFVQALNSEGYLALMRFLTGALATRKFDGAFSRYRRGHFLSPHTDASKDQRRLVAHVLSLTERWQPGWGGDLEIVEGPAGVPLTVAPRFNTLVLFDVPRRHHVTPVTTDAERHSLFGWLVEKDLAQTSTDPTRRLDGGTVRVVQASQPRASAGQMHKPDARG